MFKKILIANRGEIAVRVIRAAREMGIATVAVFSECDRTCLHVLRADEAYLLGPSAAADSYLNISKILQIAKSSGAEAIHPGYGFLAENPDFARQCQFNSICFIGPTAATMEQMGEKIAARRHAIQAGIPVVPGSESPLRDDNDARSIAEQTGFPLVLKASAGGGGKGMRLVHKAEQLSSALREARAEAKASFGDSSVYAEKYLNHPRHIEFQVLADRHGNVIHLGERECSIQRRYQKVIEECPSPLMTEEVRAEMGKAVIRLARACHYENAGTIEFLVDSERNFYFLEMNTRLQVEHPITEMVTGVDLVKEQIKIAYGEPLSHRQKDIRRYGAAIECRIYAEDPDNHFFPSAGRITHLKTPAGPGIRDDSGIYEGWTVPIYYDPLLSKSVAWGRNRDEAIQRMRRALSEYQVGGIKTTIPFFQSVLCHEKFLSGDLSTDFIEMCYSQERSKQAATSSREVATIAAALFASKKRDRDPLTVPNAEAPWKLWGRLNAFRNK